MSGLSGPRRGQRVNIIASSLVQFDCVVGTTKLVFKIMRQLQFAMRSSFLLNSTFITVEE